MTKYPEFKSGRIYFGDYCLADPLDPGLTQAMYQARYGTISKADVFRLLCVADSYVHLATHSAGTERMVQKLRRLRHAIRERMEQWANPK
jgi:hypothetical protein